MSKGAEGKARGRPRQSSEISLGSCRRLDRSSRVPLYYQLAATLYEHLEIGNWQEGTRFATERELEDEFDVSRSVVVRALGLLVADGAIERIKGKGTFIAPRRIHVPVLGLLGAISAIRRRGGAVSIEVISIQEDAADPAIVEFLSLGKGEMRIGRVVVVLHIEGRPAGLIDSHAPQSRVPWLLDAARSIQKDGRVPKHDGMKLTRAEVLVEHTSFSRWSAPILGAEAGDPAFMTRLIQFGRTAGQKDERALEFARLVHPSDKAQMISTLRD